MASRTWDVNDTLTVNPPPTFGTPTIDDIVRSLYPLAGDPVSTDNALYIANDHMPMRIANQGADWAKGATVHIGPKPSNSYSGAPWINSGTPYPLHNAWFECIAAAATNPRHVRLQIRDVSTYALNAALTTWRVTRSGSAHSGNFWHTQPGFVATTKDPNGVTIKMVVTAESTANGGGYSFSLDPMLDSINGTNKVNYNNLYGAGLQYDSSLAHGAFSAWTGAKGRVALNNGEHPALSGWARLIPEPGFSPDLSTAYLALALSADVFPTAGSGVLPVTPSLLNARHQLLTSSWQWFGWVAGSENQIRNIFPPPPFLG